jgi:putative ABC transport system substrate-binding protein
MPIWSVLFSLALLREPLSGRKIVGLALGMLGMALLLGDDIRHFQRAPTAALLVLGASIAWAFGTVLLRKWKPPLPQNTLTGWMMLLGCMPLVLLAPFFDAQPLRSPSAAGWFALVYNMFLAGTIAHAAWYTLARTLPGSGVLDVVASRADRRRVLRDDPARRAARARRMGGARARDRSNDCRALGAEARCRRGAAGLVDDGSAGIRHRLRAGEHTGCVGASRAAGAACSAPRIPAHRRATEGLHRRARTGVARLWLRSGRDVTIEYRFAEGREDQLDGLAKELIERKVAIIIVAGNQAAAAARNASRTIPIVMAAANDPVASGLVTNLARPGGNITGTTLLSSTLAGKRLELVKQLLPKVSRVAVLLNKDAPAHDIAWKETLAGAARLRIEVEPFGVQGSEMFDEAFARMSKGRMEALVVLEDAMFATERVRLAALAAKTRLPTVYGQRNSVDAGGLMSYGPSITAAYRNAASFVDRIVKGAKPGDLPIEQPTKFELVFNLKTAKALGLTIPQSLLLRADEVIQ